MKRVRQQSNAHCGPAVLQMLAQFWKLTYEQSEFVKAAGIKNIKKTGGMTPKELAMAASKITPLQFWIKQKTTFSQLAKIVNIYKVPVGIEWQGVFGKYSDGYDGHYSVVVRVDKRRKQIIIADPYRHFAGRDRYFSISQFARRWWDFNEVKTRSRKKRVIRDRQLIFLLVPHNRHFPQKLKMSCIAGSGFARQRPKKLSA